MGLGWNGLFAAVYANEEHALFASQGKIGAFKSGEVELDSLNIAVNLAHHPTMNLVMKHGPDGVRADGVREGFRFPVERAAHIAEGINADNFGVSQFELPHVHVGEPLAEFSDAVEFLLASLGKEGVVKFWCDSIDETTTDGQVVLERDS